MARKRYGEDDILRLIREVEVHCSSGMDVVSACRATGVSDKTYYGQIRNSTLTSDALIGDLFNVHFNGKGTVFRGSL